MQVVRNEARMQDHVAVDEEDVLGLRRRDRTIARASEAESLILLPDVLELQACCAPAIDHGARSGARAVVGDDHFVRPLRLPRHACEREVQGFGPVVRRYDQAAAHLIFWSKAAKALSTTASKGVTLAAYAGALRSSATGREHAALCALAKACTAWRRAGQTERHPSRRDDALRAVRRGLRGGGANR